MPDAVNDHDYLDLAIAEAKVAGDRGEVPIAALIVQNGKVIAKATNQKEHRKDPCAHAELLAVQAAAKVVGDWRLTTCEMYSTLEPCPMCAGAILHARLRRLIFAAHDHKWGAAGTKVNLFQRPALFNHVTDLVYMDRPDYQALLTQFFETLRRRQR